VVLLVGCGLFLRSFARVMAIDLGFNSSRVLTLWAPLPSLQGLFDRPESERLAFAARAQQSLGEVLAAVQAVPGVERAAVFSGSMPLSGSSNTTSMTLPSGEKVDVEVKRVSADYHAALAIPLRAGRLFTDADRAGGEPVAIVNEVAARRHFGDQPPIGHAVTLSTGRVTVVGVVGAIRQRGPETATRPEVNVPIGQARVYNGHLVIKTRTEPAALLPEIRRAVSSVLPDGVFPVTRTMDEYLDRLVAQRRFNMTLFSLFGVLGLVIAVVGIYGVMAYTVQQRTMEFGLRLALGSPRGRILGMVLGRAATFMVAGLVIGLVAALALSSLVAAFLFEVTPGDVVIYASAAGVLVITGLLAALLPARRASRVDPVVALRDN
jgi:predicted permease